jgi:23S rRNA pseudouridine1911/1915/1917 synthase
LNGEELYTDFEDAFPLRHVRSPGAPDLRLDAALGEALPGCGLRARRRLWAGCRIRVNGREREAGYLTRAGDVLEAELLRPVPDSSDERDALRVVARSADYVVFDKASGLHSAHIAGRPNASLERFARKMFSGEEESELHFLTRLDRATSGLVVAARNARAAERFRLAECGGSTRKSYLAVIRGRLASPLLLTGRLRTDNRSVSKVLREKDPDPARHCRVLPLPCRPAGEDMEDARLVRVDIMRGARHQVRAGLAAAGFPLYGDVMYGGHARRSPDGPEFFLHHARLESPELCAQSLPAWTALFADPEEVKNLLRDDVDGRIAETPFQASGRLS